MIGCPHFQFDQDKLKKRLGFGWMPPPCCGNCASWDWTGQRCWKEKELAGEEVGEAAGDKGWEERSSWEREILKGRG